MGKDAQQAAELFDEVWRRGTYSGFSRNTAGECSTPFLDMFLEAVTSVGAKSPRILELGAGSCDHAIRCAREGFATTAVEYSGVAVTEARERVRHYADLPLKIVQADLTVFTARLEPNRLTGVYANGVFHFLSSDERRNQYAIFRRALADGGVLAISFKADGDALQKRGVVVEESAAGSIVRGDDGIRRLFARDASALADEMRDEGFEARHVIRWSVPDYNIANERGEFLGIIATR
jgi:hypothetical protein